MDATFLPSRYALIGQYLGVGDILRQGIPVETDSARIRQRDMVYAFQPGMDEVFSFLQRCPSVPEYEHWLAEIDGPWGEENPAQILSATGYLVSLSPVSFLTPEYADMLTLRFVEVPEYEVGITQKVEGVESLVFWLELLHHRSFADMRNNVALSQGRTIQEIDELFGREIPLLLDSRLAFLDLAEKRSQVGAPSITSISF